MRLAVPLPITDAILTAANLPEDDFAEWDVSTDYAASDKVISTTTHRIYEAVQASGPGEGGAVDPTTDTDASHWLDIGATNRWKPFDNFIADQAVNTSGSTIEYTLDDFGVPATSVALFALVGSSASLTVTDPTDGVVFEQTISLIDDSLIVDAYTYAFEPTRVRSEAVFAPIPPYASAVFEITITNNDGDPKVGQIVFGQEYELGETIYGTQVSIEDFSVKERNAFGAALLVERPFAKLVDFDVVVPTERVRRTAIVLESVRATPCVFFAGIGLDQYGTTVFGFYKSWRITLSGPAISETVLEVEGLT